MSQEIKDSKEKQSGLYQIVYACSAEELEEMVNEQMKMGWAPLGGLQAMRYEWENDRKGYSESEWKFFQAMTLHAVVMCFQRLTTMSEE